MKNAVQHTDDDFNDDIILSSDFMTRKDWENRYHKGTFTLGYRQALLNVSDEGVLH